MSCTVVSQAVGATLQRCRGTGGRSRCSAAVGWCNSAGGMVVEGGVVEWGGGVVEGGVVACRPWG